jgi:hypothetical protein
MKTSLTRIVLRGCLVTRRGAVRMASSSSSSSSPSSSSSSSSAAAAAPSPSFPTARELCTKHSDISLLPKGRHPCPSCGSNRAWYCGDCLVAVPGPGYTLPRLRLPLKVDVLRGSEENSAKSTAAHAAVLAPDDVKVHYLPSFPTYSDPKRTLLLYPSPTSVPVSALDLDAYDALMVVDTTWQRVGGVMQTPEMVRMPHTHVHLSNYHTLFWRHQPLGPACLSTAEALYYFFREWEEERAKRELAKNGGDRGAGAGAAAAASSPSPPLYDGRYDDLLFLFLATYERIQFEYSKGAKANQTYTTKMRSGYIQGHAANGGEGAGDGAARAARAAAEEHTRKRVRGGWALRPENLTADKAEIVRQLHRTAAEQAKLLPPTSEAGGGAAYSAKAKAKAAEEGDGEGDGVGEGASSSGGAAAAAPAAAAATAAAPLDAKAVQEAAFTRMVAMMERPYAVRPNPRKMRKQGVAAGAGAGGGRERGAVAVASSKDSVTSGENDSEEGDGKV